MITDTDQMVSSSSSMCQAPFYKLDPWILQKALEVPVPSGWGREVQGGGFASRWQSCSSLRSLPATVPPTCSGGNPSGETRGPRQEVPDWVWTLASHTGGGRAGALLLFCSF